MTIMSQSWETVISLNRTIKMTLITCSQTGGVVMKMTLLLLIPAGSGKGMVGSLEPYSRNCPKPATLS